MTTDPTAASPSIDHGAETAGENLSTRLTVMQAHLADDCPDRATCWAKDIHDAHHPIPLGYLAVDRAGAPSWDSQVHDTREAAEAAAKTANAYFFNVEQPVYVVTEATPAAVYFAAGQTRSQAWIKRHLDTIERLRTLIDEHVDTPHMHPDNEGEPECPACWAADVQQIIKEGRS